MTDWTPIVAALAGIVGGGLVTFVTARSQLRIEAANAFDQSLRDLRLPHYRRLFHLTKAVPREWTSEDTPDRSRLLALRKEFHSWFFDDQASGMFLSEPARNMYFSLQNGLQSAASHLTQDHDPITEKDSVSLRKMGSALRHQLSADLGAANPARGEREREWVVPKSVPPPRS